MTITRKTRPRATSQEIFDQVAAYLLKQNQKSENLIRCPYRDPDQIKVCCLTLDFRPRI